MGTVRRPRSNNKNVYILGAGFGVDAGFPTVADFLNVMRDSADWLAQENRSSERDSVDAVLQFRHEAAAAGYRVNIDLDNIEDLFSLAAALPLTPASKNVQAAIGATLSYAKNRRSATEIRLRVSEERGWLTQAWRETATRIDTADSDSKDIYCSIYDYYASVLSGYTSGTNNPNENVVITFNYDLLLEDALTRLGLPFSYGLGDGVAYHEPARFTPDVGSDEMLLLKMHGSLNWAFRENGDFGVYGSYDAALKAGGSPHLVPPTWEKTAIGPMRRVWERAVSALTDATRVIIIGFSFRSTDAHFKYLLAAGLMNNSSLRRILIVNPRAEALEPQVRSVLRGDQFEYGVIELRNKVLRHFFYSADDLKSIGRPMTHEGIDLVDIGGTSYLEKRFFVQ